jgi:hypothetical protein
VRAEILKAEQSRGIIVDAEKFTKLANVIARGLAHIGLRPSLLDGDGERQPKGWVSQARWGIKKDTPDDAVAK